MVRLPMDPSLTINPAPPVQQRLNRFIRQPDQVAARQITDKSFQVMATIERYRFAPSSLLVRLVPGGQRNNYRHLQTLYHKNFINRFALPTVYGTPGEFVYYLDTLSALHLLVEKGLLKLPEDQLKRSEENIRLNRQRAYHQLHKDPDQQGKLLYIQHELMISRFHALLELTCRKFAGKVALEQWKQGPDLWHHVEVPAGPEIGNPRPVAGAARQGMAAPPAGCLLYPPLPRQSGGPAAFPLFLRSRPRHREHHPL